MGNRSGVRRHFLWRYGMTFQAFTRARRSSPALTHIREQGELGGAVFASGYDSQSGFRDAFSRAFGEPPAGCRDGKAVFLSCLRSKGMLAVPAHLDLLAIIAFGYPESPTARGLKKRTPPPEVANDGRFGVPFTR